MEQEYKDRDISIDIMKIIAILGVITIHVSSRGYAFPVGSHNWVSGLFWGTLTRASVPIFLMASGAIFLDPEKPLVIKKLYSKNIVRVVVAMFLWGMIYKMYHLVIGRSVAISEVIQAIKEVLLFKQEFHLYYIHIIILVYAFLPITRIFTENAKKEQVQYLLGLWFVLGIIYPTVKTFWPISLISGIPSQWLIVQAYSAIGYGVLGYYIKCFAPKRQDIYLLLYGIGFLFVFVLTWLMSVRVGALHQEFLEGMSIGPALMAVGIFGYISGAKKHFSLKTIQTINFLSRASFFVYLSHILFIYGLGSSRIFNLPYVVAIPFITMIVFVLCNITYFVINRFIVKKSRSVLNNRNKKHKFFDPYNRKTHEMERS